MSRVRNVCFTLNNYTPEEEKQVQDVECKYLVYGREIGESGTPHLQGYMEYNNPVSWSRVKQSIPRAHFESRKGTAQQASVYCKKDGDVFEKGIISQQGKRKDIDIVRDMVRDGKRFKHIQEEVSSPFCIKFAKEYIATHLPVRQWKTHVTWIYGPSETGKTSRVFEKESIDDLYVWPDNGYWFDGYEGHEAVLFDDLRKDSIQFKHLLRLLDKFAMQVPIKGSFVQWCPKRIYITTPYHPLTFVPLGEQSHQLIRRIEEVVSTCTEEV